MKSGLSRRVSDLKPSPTLGITAKAKELRSQGHDVISFAAGEPDFDTPDIIKQAAIKALAEGFTKYTPVGGTEDLKDAIRTRLKTDYGLDYARDQVIVSCGAKHSLFNIFLCLFEEGDEVLIPSPYWVSYPEMVALTGAKPVIVPTTEEKGFKMGAEDLARAVTPRTKALVLNSPCNPTGTTYGREELEGLAAVCREKDLWVISDEIYDKLVYGGKPYHSFPALSADAYTRTLLVNGVSKSYAMTGWRIGYTAGSSSIVKAMTALQGQMTSNPTSIAQKAAAVAFRSDPSELRAMVKVFDERRRFMLKSLVSIPHVRCHEAEGAFYLFPNVSHYFGKRRGDLTIRNSGDMARYLLDDAKIALVPGAEFGDDRYLRLTYAVGLDDIRKGVDRMKQALLQLS